MSAVCDAKREGPLLSIQLQLSAPVKHGVMQYTKDRRVYLFSRPLASIKLQHSTASNLISLSTSVKKLNVHLSFRL